MNRVLIIVENADKAGGLREGLTREGFTCLFATSAEEIINDVTKQYFDLMLVDMTGLPSSEWSEYEWEQLRGVKPAGRLSVVAIISRDVLGSVGADPGIDDFIIDPWDLPELVARIKRVLKRTKGIDSKELIIYGDLLIDVTRCEVSIDGRLVILTYTEYELLKFLAVNKGRVFTRDALLNEVWGYDYYGGDRTVDVNIRRLRSKIEDSTHIFIDTVRNIGYKFREESQ